MAPTKWNSSTTTELLMKGRTMAIKRDPSRMQRNPVHPGEVLLEEFLKPNGLTQLQLAEHLGVPIQRVNGLINGKRGVTADTAWLLADAFGTSPQFWLNLQINHDLAREQDDRRHIPKIKKAG